MIEIGNTLDGYVVDGDEHEGNLAAAIAFPGPLGQIRAAQQLEPVLSSALS